MLSIAITSFNRSSLTFQAVEKVIDDPRVSEIVISDDASQLEHFIKLQTLFNDIKKVKIHRNERNLGCYFNKRKALTVVQNEWAILLDSDNIIDPHYIDRIENLIVAGLQEKTVYQPEFAHPHFNFNKYSGLKIDRHNVRMFMGDSTFQTMFNACNYFVNKAEYLKVFDASIEPMTSDSIYQAYNWLKAGNNFYVVPNLEYYHRVEDHGQEEQSHYKQNVRKTNRGFHESIVEKLQNMR